MVCVCVLFCFCVTMYMAYPSHVCCSCQPRLDHIAYDHAKAHNPLRLACYSDEDAVGQIKRLAAKAYPKQLSQQVLLRYAAYCCVRWLRQMTDWHMRWHVTCATCIKTTMCHPKRTYIMSIWPATLAGPPRKKIVSTSQRPLCSELMGGGYLI